MMGFGKLAVLAAALSLLSACEFTDNAVKPSVTGTLTASGTKNAPLTPAYKISFTGFPAPSFTATGLPAGLSSPP